MAAMVITMVWCFQGGNATINMHNCWELERQIDVHVVSNKVVELLPRKLADNGEPRRDNLVDVKLLKRNAIAHVIRLPQMLLGCLS